MKNSVPAFFFALISPLALAQPSASTPTCVYAGQPYTEGAVMRSPAGVLLKCMTKGAAGGMMVGGDDQLVWHEWTQRSEARKLQGVKQ